MNTNQLQQDLAQARLAGFAQYKFSQPFNQNVLEIPKADIVPALRYLKQTGKFDMMMDLTAVDYPERTKRFDVVYNLFNTKTYARLRIKCQVGENEDIDSATPVWKMANWFEREAYDMFGIQFKGHPHLTRILCHHEFNGHPLRKDYEADQQQHCSSALPIHFEPDDNFKSEGRSLVPLNIGPSHPATHGTLRVMVDLDGERIARANVELGFLHRCFEKMAETHPYNQVIPYTDRLNYCSAPLNNIGYCKTVEDLLGVTIPERAQATRIILGELSRVIDHIICIGAMGVDLGALTSFFHLFSFREKVYTLFEKLCGARLTVSLTRIGGMAQDMPDGWLDDVMEVVNLMKVGVDDLDKMLTGNKIWMQRTQGVGAISATEAIDWAYTGPLLRAAGVPLDLRKAQPYYFYDQLDFDIPTGTTGDVYDRFLVRVAEMRESLKIVSQVCKNMPGGDYTIRDRNIVLPEKKDVYGNIEGLMNHFMLIMKGLRPPEGEYYGYTEAGNGELGFYLVSDGSGRPYRLRCRPPCFALYQSFPHQIKGGMISDVIAILGSMNLIAGELDR